MDLKMKILLLLSFTASTWAGIVPLRETLQRIEASYLPPTPKVETTCLEPKSKVETGYLSPVQESYKKEFYAFSAPEEDFEDTNAANKIASAIQKNLRVIFIRAPEQKGLEHAALHLAKHVTDDKTAIYVLSKQHDVGDLANRLTSYREQNLQKPTVHFVKYRTAAEAEQAQQTIQAQFDLLRGSTHASNEGAAPVLDFVSKQQPSYGSAISIVPAYNSGNNNNAGLYGQTIVNSAPMAPINENYNLQSSVSNVPTIPNIESLTLQSSVNNAPTISNTGSYTLQSSLSNTPTGPSIGSYSLQSSGYTNSVSSSNSFSSTVGASSTGGLPGVNVLPVDNNAYVPPPLEAYVIDPRIATRRTVRSDSIVSKLNERKHANSKMSFPSDGQPTNVNRRQ